MKTVFLSLLIIQLGVGASAQHHAVTNASQQNLYRASFPKTNELLHTKLDVVFDFDNAWLYGKAWITLQPHFFSTDSLRLDAKGMTIKEVSIVKGTARSALHFDYDGMQLSIKLDRLYKGGESYTLYVDYISRPNELQLKGSEAITGARGLYFINPTGKEKDVPVQVWTQGETESNSVWMPTIDKPNQKSTEEIYMTVPDKFVTLSNGLLASQQKNNDGTRTDYWKMDLPHAPYLFFMAVGDFAIVKDHYKGKEVSYYVDKKYAPVAKRIFGNTPKMMQFFSDRLGVEFPWPKYAQVVGHDYVSGAMENTTATLHQESAYQNARQLTDGNEWEETIAHELFHQWFGDLVTPESWSNITLSESLANYSEYLWLEYQFGKDAADEHRLNDQQEYLFIPGSDEKNLVRYTYDDREDLFDAVSYNKGGQILHMLRQYVGDDAFYKALNIYLTANKFKSAEAAQLRLAFEEVTGEDLNWFWNQWYYGNGHPKLKIDYIYNDTAGKATVIIEQEQASLFRLPIDIDIYNGAAKERHRVWLENKTGHFDFTYKKHPDLINVDAGKQLLCEKTDNKTPGNFIHQFKYAGGYADRREAIEYFYKNNLKELAPGLQDKFAGIRRITIDRLSKTKAIGDAERMAAIEQLANNEPDKKTKAAAIRFLIKTGNAKYEVLYNKYLSDSSYTVAAACLNGIEKLAPAKAYDLAKKLSADAEGQLGETVSRIIAAKASEADFDFIANRFNRAPVDQQKFSLLPGFANYLSKLSDTTKIKTGIDYIVRFSKSVPDEYRQYTNNLFKTTLDQIGKAKGAEVTAYINAVYK